MTKSTDHTDYRVRRSPDKSASTGAAAGSPALTECLQLLAKAVRQFHTYPATSPMCTDAIDACQRAFIALDLEQGLSIRVVPEELIVDEQRIGRGTIIEQELSRPLHRAHVGSLEIDRASSTRDWCQFCTILARTGRGNRAAGNFAELLLDAGVATIVAQMTPRPEVLQIGVLPPPVLTLVHHERERQAAAMSGPAKHLYPPDKGWVRLDPAVRLDSLSLVDLTVLVNDPAELAAMLTCLIDEEGADEASSTTALEQRYGDVVKLIGALDPRLGRLLFSKLARAVLDLDSDRRRALLRRAILPDLLDGRVDAEAVLAEFPDVELADALCLLLDLEAAAPQMLPVALERLRLPVERRTKVVPLIEERLTARSPQGEAKDAWAAAGLDRYAAALTRVEAGAAKDFGEFVAYDLSVNAQTTATLTGLCDAITATEEISAQLTCASSLAAIEPNPAVVAAVLARAVPALQALVRAERWQDTTRWIVRFADLANGLDASRADVAKTVRDTLARFADRAFVVQLAQLGASEAGRTFAAAIVAAVGPSVLPAWFEALDMPADRTRVRPLASLMADCASRLAPAIAERLPALQGDSARAAVTVLGFAGAGFETIVASQLTAADERQSREALRALARIGSPKAAALIVGQLESGPPVVQPAAEEALWRLPPAIALAKTRELLGRREYVTRHPQAAARLLERAVQSADDAFDPVLASLVSLRFHFWSPAVARVGAKARELLQ